METIQYYKSNGSRVIVTVLDMTKAFDVVRFDTLFKALNKLDLCHLICRMLVNLYMSTKYFVLWNNYLSEGFNITNGVKQGGVLSPLLFSIYCNPLIDLINNSGKGCQIGGRPTAIFIYADDIILLSPTRGGMQQLLNISYEFVNEIGLMFNMGKCKIILYGTFYNMIPLHINGENLNVVENEEHLGHLLGSSNILLDLSNSISDMKCKANCIVREFNHLCTESKRTMFTANCMSLYGCQLIDLNSSQLVTLNVEWRKSIRYIFNVDNRTHNVLIPALIKTPNVEIQIMCRMVNFFKNGLNHKDSYISFLFSNAVLGYHSYFSKNINTICAYSGLTMYNFLNKSTNFITKRIKDANMFRDWRFNMIEELMMVRDGIMTCDLNDTDVNELLKYICTA